MDSLVPPNNIEAEELTIGGILFDPRAIGKIADILMPDAFYVKAHQKMYQAALELYHKNQPTDLITVTNWLQDHDELESLGGFERLAQLLERTVSAANIDRYAEIIMDKYQRRQLITTSYEIGELGYDTTLELEEVLEQSESKIFDLTTQRKDPLQYQPIKNCVLEVFNQLKTGQAPFYPTGLPELDTLTGGLLQKDLIIIAARASMGKTWLACHLTNFIADKQKLPVVFFSAEMSREQLTKRFLAMHSGIDSSRLIQNQIYESEFDNLVTGLKYVAELPIIIDDTSASMQNPTKMRSVLRRVKSQHSNIGLVVMDYIQKLGDRAAGNRAQTVGKFSGAFKDIAKEFDVPFVALAQINRGVEGQTNKRPLISDIKDSGDIEQDGDLILLLYRDEYYNSDSKDKGVMEIHIGKNRNGATGVARVRFNPMTGLFQPYQV